MTFNNNRINQFADVLESIITLFKYNNNDNYSRFQELEEIRKNNPNDEFALLFLAAIRLLDVTPTLLTLWSIRNNFDKFQSADDVWDTFIQLLADQNLTNEATLIMFLKTSKLESSDVSKLLSDKFDLTTRNEIYELYLAVQNKFTSTFDPLFEVLDGFIEGNKSITSNQLNILIEFAPTIKKWCEHQIELERGFCD